MTFTPKRLLLATTGSWDAQNAILATEKLEIYRIITAWVHLPASLALHPPYLQAIPHFRRPTRQIRVRSSAPFRMREHSSLLSRCLSREILLARIVFPTATTREVMGVGK